MKEISAGRSLDGSHEGSGIILGDTLAQILPPDEAAAARCRQRWNRIAKPLYGLGTLEELVVRIAAAQGTDRVDIGKKALVVFCADNGVVAEGVSQTGQETTAIVAENFIDGRTCAAIMCRRAGADLFPVDVGMAVDTPRVEKRKCRRGTSNMAEGPAMTREEALFALETGIGKAQELAEAGYRILAAGEMGIGNTTTSAAVVSVLLGMDPETVTGRGAGLSAEGLEKKTAVIRRAIAASRPDPQDPLDVLARVGGFDIAAMTGLYLGAAACRVPVVMDGLISGTAALLAVRLAPRCRHYILPSHLSDEPAAKAVMEALGFFHPEDRVLSASFEIGTKIKPAQEAAFALGSGPASEPANGAVLSPEIEAAAKPAGGSGPAGRGRLVPVLRAGMHLGEGTGAVALFPLLDMACDVYTLMDTFDGIHVTQYEDYR